MTPNFSFNIIRPANGFRVGTAIFAGLLGLAAVWMLSVELIRPTLPFFPIDAAAAEATAAHRGAARAAAWVGLIRGDLWTDYAMTLAPNLSGELTGNASATSLQAVDSARTAAVRAAELAPYDARAWLLLAGVDSLGLNHSAAGPLKMSYYAGPNELSLIPLRIKIASQSNAITDSELQTLVGGEIRTIITRKPDLMPVIVDAYRNALPEGRHFIETQVGDLDPSLLASLRETSRPR
jgi:hypothetical protein